MTTTVEYRDLPRSLRCLLLVGAGVLMLTSCTSISGNRLHLDATGKLVGVENIGGLPILVQRPNRAVFVATTKVFDLYRVEPTATGTGTVVTKTGQTESETTVERTPILVGPYEVYALDVKRPMLGTIDYKMELANAYPTKIEGKVDDKTLDKLMPLIDKLLSAGLGLPPVAKEAGEGVERRLARTETALVVFDLQSGTVTIQKF